MTAIRTLAGALLVISQAAHAVQLSCAEDLATNAHFCYPPAQIKERGGIRTAPLYMGGPNSVRATTFTIAANCTNGVMHLKDRDGVSFAGTSAGEGTTHSRKLRRIFCEEKVPTAARK